MSKNIESTKINDLLPSSVASDVTINALASAISSELKTITESINKILFYPNIEQLPEEIIDLLAEQFKVSFYDVLGLDLRTKRELVKKAIVWNKRKGTKAVMQEMLSTLYNSEAVVQEWFEYGGEPYYFRILIDNLTFDEEAFNTVILIINELKNVRSHLDNITIKLTIKDELYFGAVAVIYNKRSVRTNLTKLFKEDIFTANVVVIRKKILVKGALIGE